VPPAIRFGEQDKVRTWALYDLALAGHDAAIGRLVAELRALGRDQDTAIVVTGDVSVDESAHVPFGDGETLDEAPLRVPLILRPAGGAGALAGKHVGTPTSGLDVARTVLVALGLTPPTSFGGVDLWEIASTPDAPARPLLATLGERYLLRWGPFVLSGAPEREPKLCNLSLEPVCATDVRSTHPIAAQTMIREAIDALAPLPPKAPKETPTLDAAAAAAIKAWGR
jgi:Sulfatase